MRNLEFDPSALEDLTYEDLTYWEQTDRKKALRVLRLLEETLSDPFGGLGNPNRSNTSSLVVGRNELTMNIVWFIE